jgi:hypothetical protein
MDWLTFISNIAHAAAWPLVVLLILLFLRPFWGVLVARLKEISLPGGGKAKFTSEFQSARKQSSKLPKKAETSAEARRLTHTHAEALSFYNDHPVAAILEAFAKLEYLIVGNFYFRDAFDGTVQEILDKLKDEKYLDEEAVKLFDDLFTIRTRVADEPRGGVTPREAKEFVTHIQKLMSSVIPAIKAYNNKK